ncbi:uncharacterized protein F5891DRAFT_979916 [Suillus fuscotomentosus]|uniref:DUF6532 domain-containing protein n=1 Tax=Suillus fuscotomentosus TaxID=1912939 RepID=A0AAD4HLN5_9AGAM|nr:uncharacterized protein F5891DRAFT_979916 [Suillus fuscotomentosus]KAG1901032.1 hypothetical protein F5891DRAFT_979916 [Suillus fuscotomentosus]
MSASQNAPPRAHQRVVRDVPIVRQPGLNIAGQHPFTKGILFYWMAPHTAGPDRVQRSFAPAGDVASRYCMEYTYLPLRGVEKSHQEYTDGVVFRDETTGVQKSTIRQYKLPPVRPPRESLVSDPEPTPLATTTPPSASSTVTRATHATAGPLVNEKDSKTVVKDAKNYVVVETLNNRTTVVGRALTDACSLIITEDSLRKLWVDENLSALYKTVIMPMSTILNRFKQSAQDLVEILYSLQLSIWTDLTAQINHTKSTVTFLIRDDSLNYIFGDSVMLDDGRNFRFPFEHDTIIQIALFINSDSSLDNIMALSVTAACCSLHEFSTGVFKQIDFSYATFNRMWKSLQSPLLKYLLGNAGYIPGQFNTFPTKPGPAGPMGCQGSFLMKNYPHI